MTVSVRPASDVERGTDTLDGADDEAMDLAAAVSIPRFRVPPLKVHMRYIGTLTCVYVPVGALHGPAAAAWQESPLREGLGGGRHAWC